MHPISTLKRTSSKDLPPHWVEQWLLFVLKKPKNFLITDADYTPTADEYQRFLAGIQRMQQGEPLAYLTQCAYFWSLPFLVSPDTLIPRPDTELLVEQTLRLCQTIPNKPPHLLELGTGSGCVIVSIGHSLKEPAHLTATDRCPKALAVAAHNAKIHKVAIEFRQGSWFEAVKESFDIILSNPPYIAPNDAHLQALQAEPYHALVAHEDGLADLYHIIAHAPKHLNDGGFLLLEHGYNQAQNVQACLQQHGYQNIHTHRDLGGNLRLSSAQFFTKPKTL